MGYAPEEGKVRFTTTPQTCPDSAKVGTLTSKTPLLENELPGLDLPRQALRQPLRLAARLYLVVEDEQTGILAKLAGQVEPDPTTGS